MGDTLILYSEENRTKDGKRVGFACFTVTIGYAVIVHVFVCTHF